MNRSRRVARCLAHFHPIPCRRCGAIEHAIRYRAAMEAMSRFLVWVWCEALAGTWFGKLGIDDEACRGLALLDTIVEGRLRLSWPDAER